MKNFEVTTIDGKPLHLATAFPTQVLLVVNVASECGYTPQYAGLEALHRRFAPQGFAVFGFPCNDFGAQEPGDEAAIAHFCEVNFGVSFPMFAKVNITSQPKAPLYAALTETPGPFAGEVRWNFHKFLIGRDGTLLGRFDSRVAPDAPELLAAIEAALAG